MSALPEDDELSALLNDLDDIDEDIDVPSLSIQTKPVKQPKKTIEEHTEEPETHVPEHKGDESLPASNDIDLNILYSSSIQELLSNYRKDRQDLDQYITYLWEKLGKSEPSRVFFETLAITLRTKSEANSNLVKLLDSINKRLDKSHGGVDELNLEDLLDD